jgi:hypothetical protein
LKWLDSKKPNSGVYICLGSMANFTASQLKEIAAGLKASEHQFIWVVRRNEKSQEDKGDCYLKDLRKEWKAKGTPSF